MRQLPLFLVLLAICACGSFAGPVQADPPQPAEPAPPSDPAKPSDPPPAPPAEPPPAPAPEDPEAAKKRAEEEEKKRLEEEEKERQADEEARKKREGQQPPAEEEEPRAAVPPAPRPGPPGMVYLPPAVLGAAPQTTEGTEPAPAPTVFDGAVIGTKAEELAKLLGNRPPEVRRFFDFERPQHRRNVRECYYDQFEVTNAQYARFIKEHAATYVCDGKYATLVDYAAYFLGTPADRAREDDVSWRQLAHENKERLLAAMPALADKPWPEAFKDVVLPKRDLVLMFCTRRPPDDWPGIAPKPERLSHPVRFVSGLDAEAFAEWAGKHLQTEFEYEWAARGPDAPTYPWGNVWHRDTEYCNWGAKVLDEKTHEADTWVVGSRPKGRSWVGAHDTVGNVAEWTSSLFTLYPSPTEPKVAPDLAGFLGAVNVIRGGTAVDQEQLVLRPAARNFVGTGFNSGPPYLSNRYAWVGFRCAWWPQPGANQAPYIERRITRGGRIKAPVTNKFGEADKPGDLDLARVGGTVAENPALADAQNGVFVEGRTKAVVLLPRRWLLDTDVEKEDAILHHGRSKTRDGLLAQSETEVPEILLGAFHTDVKLPKVWVRKKLTPEEKAALQKAGKRGRSPVPPLVEGSCPPGSYIVAVWHKMLVLTDGSREFVCSLTAPGKQASLDVKKVKEDALPACKVAVDDTVNLVNGTLTLPLATGKTADPLIWVHASFSLEAEADDLSMPNGWR